MKLQNSSLDGMPLPWVVNCIAETAGIDVAMKLCLERSGQRIHVPTLKRVKGTKFEKLVGEEAAALLCAKFGGQKFEVPVVRNPLVFWLRDKGWSQEKIAQRVRMSRRNVQYVLSKNSPKLGPWPDAGEVQAQEAKA
jgi:hypothetical protein